MMKRIAIAVLALLCLITCASAEELTGLTATEIVSRMGIGWNLGNTFDATGGDPNDVYSQEQSWGNAIVDESLIARVKEAGFETIRIPVTWYRHTSKDGNYTINPAFLARVKEVVDYAYAQDMYVIINMHHEEWLNNAGLATEYEKIGVQLGAMWQQIADTFADYDQHLIFEGMNEPRLAGTGAEWNGNAKGYEAVNYLNQVFVETVRTNPKGRNAERCLMIPGYAASSSKSVMRQIKLPVVDGRTAENLIISVHCYSPYDFCLSDKQVDFDPSKSGHVKDINYVFSSVQELFIDQGIPVVIGETGATNTGNNLEARERWAYYMGSKAAAYGVPIVIWDNGNNKTSGGECHAWVRRSVNSKLRSQSTPYVIPTVIEQLMAGASSIEWGTGRDTPKPVKSAINGTVLWANAAGRASTKEWDNSFIQLASDEKWYAQGRTFAVIYTGSGAPKLVLDSAEKEQWWMPVDPDRTDNLGAKKVAWFSCDKLTAEIAGYGVTDPAQLRNLCVIATNGAITVYEVCYVGK